MSDTVNLGDFIELSRCLYGERFEARSPFAYLGKALGPWLERLLDELGVGDAPEVRGEVHPGAYVQGRVFIAEGAVVEPTAYVQGPCYIGPGTEVRHGAYVRGMVYAGRDCVIGHTTEVKGSLFFDGAKAGHFAYVGDSILGRDVNLGAGTKLANLPLRRGEIRVRAPRTNAIVGTGLQKFGAVMGDEAQTGCNAVLSPGTLLLPRTGVFPCVHYRGTLTEGIVRTSL
jgi:NDP-sugar pyrophosphorylase family protein